MHIQRTLTDTVVKASQYFYVVLLTGARQVGKTTLLQSLLKQDNRSYVSLDDIDTRIAAEQDPANFISRLKLPVLIDEIQYAPSLIPYIKMHIDMCKKPGMFWLTGSQQFSLMKNVTESLAGRVAILTLHGISLAEEEGRAMTAAFVPTQEALQVRHNQAKVLDIPTIYHKIWRGSYPHLVINKGETWQLFYESYITSYLERDVRDYLQVDNLMIFRKFLQVAAVRSGQMLNYREVSRDVGVAEPTVKSWFNVLQATGIITLLPPYFNNLTKRLLKTPKFYFNDTGLCCFLSGWLNADVLERGAMAGAILETYVVMEIIKSYIHNGLKPRLYYYADKDKHEIDLIIEDSGCLHPIEIKKAATIKNMHFSGFEFLKKLKVQIGHGCVLCFHKNLVGIKPDIDAVPLSYI